MVLEHVAQYACPVIVPRSAPNADALGHCDLDIVHIVAVPERLKDGVGKAKGQEILYRLLAEVVVDAIDLSLVEYGVELVVQRPRAVEVVSKGLFDDDAPPPSVTVVEVCAA